MEICGHMWRRKKWNSLSDPRLSDLQIHTKQHESLEMVKKETIGETLLKSPNWKLSTVLDTDIFPVTIDVKDAKQPPKPPKN